MTRKKFKRLFILLLFLQQSFCQRVEWDASNFPNPTAGDFKRCNMKTTANICDPDQVLSEQERYRLNHELHQLESRTRQGHAPDFCQKKGITAAMAIAKHVRGGSQEAVKEMANQMLRKWSLDNQCQKSVVIVVATEDKRFWVARAPRVPVYAAEFTQIFIDQKNLFEQGQYQQALANIVQQTWERALSKQGPGAPEGPGPVDGDFGKGGIPEKPRYGPDGPGSKMMKLPSIPFWIWLVLILVVIPILCCCCCLCYCCFCRGKGSSGTSRRQRPSDIGGGGGIESGGRPGRSGIGGGGLNNFLGGLGGAGIGSIAGRMLSGGSRGGGLGGLFGGHGSRGGGAMDMSGYQGGGAYPSAPSYPTGPKSGGRGLYPSAVVEDEGGGGSWGR